MSTRRALVFVAQLAFAALIVWLAWRQLAPQWDDVGAAWSQITPSWPLIGASCALVLAAYLLLIAVWRDVVASYGFTIPPLTAARIWFVSNLGRYIPGKVWQIAAMGTMSHQAGVAAGAAVGSSLLIAVINIIAGVVVVLVTARDALPLPPYSVVLLAVLTAAVALVPNLLPRVASVAARAVGRTVQIPPLRYGVLVRTFIGCGIAWMMYGVAFQLLAQGTLPDAGGAARHYIALFTSSYIAGYVTPWAPGGIGVRETALVAQMELYGLMTAPSAAVLAIVSRIWLTVLELLPGLLFLVSVPRSRTPTSDDV